MLVLFALFTVTFARHVDLPSIALQNPDLFEGDIIGVEDNDVRNAIMKLSRRWTGGVMPYVIDPELRNIKRSINEAMKHINRATGGCISFKERKEEKAYIRFIKGKGCYSHVGRIGRQQIISLGNGCGYVGTIVHEIVHALGFHHEQNRSDRDDYLIIHWQNIKKGMEGQFVRLQPDKNVLYVDFDYDSIMIYGNYAFSKDGKSKTMEAKTGVKLLEPYAKKPPYLASSDVYRIKKLYECA
ncbi:astacin-like metalloprotease toxin 5 [Centruroides sculpturatus]|uniref:astacin-like metalloprotease toxin 5 n=1 Tax=Centruroides sculpturatus TaxID=218467 RepID=UPI000C6E06EF|nr:astacin-like metalloprotease toxin 5 [Centruroides sculpturatus]